MARLPAVLLLSTLAAPAVAGEMRGLWVVRTGLLSPDTVDRVVDQAKEAGVNTLFVQVRGRGDAFYNSQLAPRSDLLRGQPPDFDPLGHLLTRARQRGLRVHAWVNVLLVASFSRPLPPGHVLTRHPEWAMVPRQAARLALSAAPARLLPLAREARGAADEGYYLSPSAPGVGEHLEAVVRELLQRYDVDGLHLDFVRYPGPEYDYSRLALESFQRRQRLEGGDLLAGPAEDPVGWGEHRRQVLTSLVEKLSGAARRLRPGLLVSAAVNPDEAQAVEEKYQSWPSWAARGLVDVVCPMSYTPDTEIFRGQVERAVSRAGAPARVWAGVGAFRLDVPGIVEKVKTARETGAGGVILFSHESLDPRDLDRLRREAFASAKPAGAGGSAHR